MRTLAGSAVRLFAACAAAFCALALCAIVFRDQGMARAETCVSASWYHEGSRTATGERYRADGLTAAHRTLRLGTRLQVFNKRNGRSVTVRVNDRGPARWTKRSLDLSRGAARQIGMIHSGVGPVCYHVVAGVAEADGGAPAPTARAARRTQAAAAKPSLTKAARIGDGRPEAGSPTQTAAESPQESSVQESSVRDEDDGA